MDPVVGVPQNPLAPNVPRALLAAAERAGTAARTVDLATLVVEQRRPDGLQVRDGDGEVRITHLAPPLLYWQPAAAVALQAGESLGWRCLNPVGASRTADDKAATAVALAREGVPQLRTVVAPHDATVCRQAARELGYPVVVKRAHGAQGRWVRRADDEAGLQAALTAFAGEDRDAVLVQELCREAAGRSVRVICTGGQVVAATERQAARGELRSNIGAGGSQRAVDLGSGEAALALRAASVLGLGHAGVDLLRTADGPVVLEVNACPDFTSMTPYVERDVAADVLAAVLAL